MKMLAFILTAALGACASTPRNEHTPPPPPPVEAQAAPAPSPPTGQPMIRDGRESPDAPMPAEQIQRPAPNQAPGMPAPAPPAANPLPPTQVPPAPAH